MKELNPRSPTLRLYSLPWSICSLNKQPSLLYSPLRLCSLNTLTPIYCVSIILPEPLLFTTVLSGQRGVQGTDKVSKVVPGAVR